MPTTTTIDALEYGVMYAAPIIGGALACILGMRAKTPGSALLRTFILSILFSCVIGMVVGASIDASLAHQQWQRWDALWLTIGQIPFGSLAGLVFGLIAMKATERKLLKAIEESNTKTNAA